MYNEETNTVENAPGVETRLPGFGNTDTIDHLDTDNLVAYFAPMTDIMVSWGYERGCPYTLVFLNKQPNSWKDKYIFQWITLSGQ